MDLRIYKPYQSEATRYLILSTLSEKYGHKTVLEALVKRCGTFATQNKKKCLRDREWLEDTDGFFDVNEADGITTDNLQDCSVDIVFAALENEALSPMVRTLLNQLGIRNITTISKTALSIVCVIVAYWLVKNLYGQYNELDESILWSFKRSITDLINNSTTALRNRLTSTVTITLPVQTIYNTVTLPKETQYNTVTLPRRTDTVTLPRRTDTVTLPRETQFDTVTLPRETQFDTVTLPRETQFDTVTLPRETQFDTVTLPRETQYDTVTLPRETVTEIQAATVIPPGKRKQANERNPQDFVTKRQKLDLSPFSGLLDKSELTPAGIRYFESWTNVVKELKITPRPTPTLELFLALKSYQSENDTPRLDLQNIVQGALSQILSSKSFDDMDKTIMEAIGNSLSTLVENAEPRANQLTNKIIDILSQTSHSVTMAKSIWDHLSRIVSPVYIDTSEEEDAVINPTESSTTQSRERTTTTTRATSSTPPTTTQSRERTTTTRATSSTPPTTTQSRKSTSTTRATSSTSTQSSTTVVLPSPTSTQSRERATTTVALPSPTSTTQQSSATASSSFEVKQVAGYIWEALKLAADPNPGKKLRDAISKNDIKTAETTMQTILSDACLYTYSACKTNVDETIIATPTIIKEITKDVEETQKAPPSWKSSGKGLVRLFYDLE